MQLRHEAQAAQAAEQWQPFLLRHGAPPPALTTRSASGATSCSAQAAKMPEEVPPMPLFSSTCLLQQQGQ